MHDEELRAIQETYRQFTSDLLGHLHAYAARRHGRTADSPPMEPDEESAYLRAAHGKLEAPALLPYRLAQVTIHDIDRLLRTRAWQRDGAKERRTGAVSGYVIADQA